jgi:hypothetical protein
MWVIPQGVYKIRRSCRFGFPAKGETKLKLKAPAQRYNNSFNVGRERVIMITKLKLKAPAQRYNNSFNVGREWMMIMTMMIMIRMIRITIIE